MAKLKNLTIRNALFCEEIRQEKSGKYMLIGVFPSDISIGKLPATIPIALYIDAEAKRPEGQLTLRLSGPGEGTGLIKMDYQQAPDVESNIVALVTPRLEVLMEKEGTFKIEISENEKEWLPLIEKKVALKSNLLSMFPNVYELPSEQSPPDAPESSSRP